MGKTYFYARVSTATQSLKRQIEAAKDFKIDKLWADKASGKDFSRKNYRLMKEAMEPGDTLIVKELDRLGRNKEGVLSEMRWFKEHDITLRILNLPTTLIDVGEQTWIMEMVNNIMVELMSSIAEQERLKIRERQREGIDAMEVVDGQKIGKSGRPSGRPGVMSSRDVRRLRMLNPTLKVDEFCQLAGLTPRAYYYHMNRTKDLTADELKLECDKLTVKLNEE